jgi:glycosyltransferase involved in cell wall biosynthesis
VKKLNIVIMGQDCEEYLKICLKSLLGQDRNTNTLKQLIYLDGGSTDKSVDIALEYGAKVLHNRYNQEDMGMNGKQRNFYLDYLKKHHMGEWCLVLDADEVIGDIDIISKFINRLKPEEEDYLISVKMRHFIGNLGFEDSIEKEHFVQHRLFKVRPELIYEKEEHAVLWLKEGDKMVPGDEATIMKHVRRFKGTTIWHLGHAGAHLFDIKQRHENNLKKSKIHSKDFLERWNFSHMFGIYPVKPVRAIDIPPVILEGFGINPDKVYFASHNKFEMKHFLMMREWKNHFNCKSLLDLGCGMGLFGFAADAMGIYYLGIEKSEWAVENRKYKHLNIMRGDIRTKYDFENRDLVLVFDVLEHLEEKDLDKTLNIIKEYGKNFLFSIPFIGDPNLSLDPTHKIFKSKEWWVKKLEKYFKLSKTPDDFMFKEQIIIGVKK